MQCKIFKKSLLITHHCVQLIVQKKPTPGHTKQQNKKLQTPTDPNKLEEPDT